MTNSPRQPSPFEMIGGQPSLDAIANHFYDLLESDPAYAPLRALHDPDLAPMRTSLAGFLAAWTGGPRTWFEERPNGCMMSLHRPLPITADLAAIWCGAMRRAIAHQRDLDGRLADAFGSALERMALGMVNRA